MTKIRGLILLSKEVLVNVIPTLLILRAEGFKVSEPITHLSTMALLFQELSTVVHDRI
jgi:hypothetical protein